MRELHARDRRLRGRGGGGVEEGESSGMGRRRELLEGKDDGRCRPCKGKGVADDCIGFWV